MSDDDSGPVAVESSPPMWHAPRLSRQIMHFCEEARRVELGASWRMRTGQILPVRLALVGGLAALKIPQVRRLAVDYAVSTRLDPSWSVIGMGGEQIVCTSTDEPGVALKVVYPLTAKTAHELDGALAHMTEAGARLQSILGPFNVPTDFSIEPVSRSGRRYAVVARQPLVTIVESVFLKGGILSDRAEACPVEVRADLASRLRHLVEDKGIMVDLANRGNLVMVAEHDRPVLIDNLPFDAVSNPTVAATTRSRIDILASGEPENP